MARSVSIIKQHDAKKLFRAAKDAGFPSASIILHPDGTVEARVSMAADHIASAEAKNAWDEVL